MQKNKREGAEGAEVAEGAEGAAERENGHLPINPLCSCWSRLNLNTTFIDCQIWQVAGCRLQVADLRICGFADLQTADCGLRIENVLVCNCFVSSLTTYLPTCRYR